MKNTSVKKSVLHLMHPSVKGLLCITFIVIFSLLCDNWLVTLNLNLFLIFLCFYLKEDPLGLLSSIRKIWLLLVIVGAFQGFVGPTFDIYACLCAVFRVLGVYLTANIYTRISPQNELLYFWEKCFKPINLIGFSSSELALTMVIAIRFFPVLFGEIERIRMAQIARGAKLSSNKLIRAFDLMPLLIPVLTQAIQRSEELADAMEVRGYVANRPRGSYKKYEITGYDVIAILTTAWVIFLI